MWIVRDPIPGCVHHVIARFIDRDFLIPDDAAREHYLWLLGRAMRESDWRCLAYAIMSSHIHLAMLAGPNPAERWMRRVHPPFAAWTNKRLERIGPMFAGSPAIWVVRRENELRLVAYLHNNPVRAGVVTRARESTWTSHRIYLGLKASSCVDAASALARFGVTADELDGIVDQNIGYKPVHQPIDPVRRAARKRGAIEVATPMCEDTVVPLVARPFAHFRPDPAWLVEVVAEVTDISAALLRSRDRSHAVIAARALAVQCGRAAGLTISEVAAAIGISAQRGSVLGLRALTPQERLLAEVIQGRVTSELAAALLKNRKGSYLNGA
jgi:hypothetical protein